MENVMNEFLQDGPAPAPGANETLNAVERELQDLFDLDGLVAALRKNSTEPINMPDFERERGFPHHPENFSPTFYQHAGDSPGISVTSVAKCDIVYERLRYPTFRKCEDLQQPGGNIAIRGVRAAALSALQQSAAIRTIVAPGHAHTLAAISTAQQLNRELGPSRQSFTAECFAAPDMAQSLLQKLASNRIPIRGTYATLEAAMGSGVAYANRERQRLALDPRKDAAIIAGQATAFIEYFTQLREQGVDTRKHRVNLRVPVEYGTAFIGAAVVWRWLKENELLTRGSNLVAVQAEGNDALVRAFEKTQPLSAEEAAFDTTTYPTGTPKANARVVPVMQAWADDIQLVAPEYMVQACALNTRPDKPLPGLYESLSLGAVLMDAEADQLDQSIPELTITKGVSPRQDFLASTVEAYTTHDTTAVSQAAERILQVLQAQHEAHRQELAARSAKKAAASPTPQQAQTKAKQAKAAPSTPAPASAPASLPRASESYSRGLQVWRGPR